jgi:8-oxo-dGTP diphosphatase
MDSAKYCYDYPRPAVSADIVVFGFDGLNLQLLLIKRRQEPYKNNWALPGGFLEMDETIENCAARELFEETAIKDVKLEQLRAFSAIMRDPRGRVITIAFWTIIEMKNINIRAGDDATQAGWFKLNSLPKLAFDHFEILIMAIEKLKTINRVNLNEISDGLVNSTSFDQQAMQKALANLIPHIKSEEQDE